MNLIDGKDTYNHQSSVNIATLSISSSQINNENDILLQNTSPSLSTDLSQNSSNQRVVKSILKKHSDYPKAKTIDDWPPVRIAEKGRMKHFTKDKYGKTIPYLFSFWFMEERYKQKARKALETHLRLLTQKKKKIAEYLLQQQQHDDTQRRTAAAMAMITAATTRVTTKHDVNNVA
jgi:hypothetical protein